MPHEQPRQPLRVAMIGYAFMGAAHSQAWRTAGRVFDLPVATEMRLLCGRDAEAAEAAAARLGWAEWCTDWQRGGAAATTST